MTCLIIDDEQLARNLLAAYATRLPHLTVLQKCKNALEAQAFLAQQTVDLLLLDIQMPKLTGIHFLRQLQQPPKVIFTTAYSQYALEGYELEVVDYLLKPISFERFEKAIEKAKALIEQEEKAQAYENQQNFEQESILVKDGYDYHKILLKDILYIQAMREYVTYHTVSGKVMALKALSLVEQELPAEHFMRIHRSYIVAKAAVQGQQKGKLVLKNGVTVPLGKTYKAKILKCIFVKK